MIILKWTKGKYVFRLDWQVQVRNSTGFWFEQCWNSKFCYFNLHQYAMTLSSLSSILFINDIITWYILHCICTYILLHSCYNCIKSTSSFLWFSNSCLARASLMSLQYFKLHIFASGLFCFAILRSSDVVWIIPLPILVFCNAPNFKFSQKHSQSCMKPLF